MIEEKKIIEGKVLTEEEAEQVSGGEGQEVLHAESEPETIRTRYSTIVDAVL